MGSKKYYDKYISRHMNLDWGWLSMYATKNRTIKAKKSIDLVSSHHYTATSPAEVCHMSLFQHAGKTLEADRLGKQR